MAAAPIAIQCRAPRRSHPATMRPLTATTSALNAAAAPRPIAGANHQAKRVERETSRSQGPVADPALRTSDAGGLESADRGAGDGATRATTPIQATEAPASAHLAPTGGRQKRAPPDQCDARPCRRSRSRARARGRGPSRPPRSATEPPPRPKGSRNPRRSGSRAASRRCPRGRRRRCPPPKARARSWSGADGRCDRRAIRRRGRGPHPWRRRPRPPSRRKRDRARVPLAAWATTAEVCRDGSPRSFRRRPRPPRRPSAISRAPSSSWERAPARRLGTPRSAARARSKGVA